MTTQERAPADRVGADGPRRAAPDWLALRRGADTEARDAGAALLLARLVDHLRGQGTGPVRVVDVGAGTGANHAYLSPRLPVEQRWVVVDHDADLLAHAGHGDALRVEAGVCDLVGVLEDLAADEDGRLPMLVTCAALLDVLTAEELGCLADAVEGSAAPALLSLSVTGEVSWSPSDPADGLVAGLFDAHQRRGGRPGPQGVAHLVADLRSRGLEVLTSPTPWRLDDRRPRLLARWLDERVAAAVAQLSAQDGDDSAGRRELADWHARRRAQQASAGPVAHVGHVDVLVLPH